MDRETIEHLREMENGGKEPTTVGYIPTDYSGVTVSSGIDMGWQNMAKMKGLGIMKSSRKKCEPYFGLKSRKAVEDKGLVASNLVLTTEEALDMERKCLQPCEDAVEPYTDMMSIKGQAVLTSLQHWNGSIFAMNEGMYNKLGFMVDGKMVNYVSNAVKGKTATDDDLNQAMEDTKKHHKERTGGFNRLKREIEYLGCW